MSVYDYEGPGSKGELIGHINEKFSAVDKNDRKLPLKWYNIYGAPEFKQGKLVDNIVKGGKEIYRGINSELLGAVNYYTLYNNVPERASAYKGRALLQFRIETPQNRPKKFRKAEIKPFRRKIKALPKSLVPPAREYILQAAIFNGSDLPGFTDVSLRALAGLIARNDHIFVTNFLKRWKTRIARSSDHWKC